MIIVITHQLRQIAKALEEGNPKEAVRLVHELREEIDEKGVHITTESALATAEQRVKEIGESLDSMLWQFAYKGAKGGKSILHTGGLSALEEAFSVLGWEDPHEVGDGIWACDVEGCADFVSASGLAWSDTGYWCVCPNHSRQAREGKPQPTMKERATQRESSRDKKTGRLPLRQEIAELKGEQK